MQPAMMQVSEIAPKAVQEVREARQDSPHSGKELPRPDAQASREELSRAVEHIKDFVQSIHRSLRFNIDDSSGHTVITVTDSETNEVVRQIPSEEVLQVARSLEASLDEQTNGVLFKTEA